MKTTLFAIFLIFAFCCSAAAQYAQINQAILIRIVRAEDERRFDADLQNLLKSADAKIRSRAALAVGRIGDERAVDFLIPLLEKDQNADVRQMAAFALGEIESAKAAGAIFRILQNLKEPDSVRARAVEAAGKIGAANAKDPKAKDLSEAVLDALDTEHTKQNPNREIILHGLTAALRTRGEAADLTIAKFLTDKDERVRADALNTLARLRAKNENTNAQMRALLLSDDSPVVRANAARALGAAEDKLALNLLIEAAQSDDDLRVRVSAIRSLAALKDKTAAAPLLLRGIKLFDDYIKAGSKSEPIIEKSGFARSITPTEKNELLEIITTLGRLLQLSEDENTVKFLDNFRRVDSIQSPETEIALARVAPELYLKGRTSSENKKDFIYPPSNDWLSSANLAQGLAEAANLLKENRAEQKSEAEKYLRIWLFDSGTSAKATPDILRAYSVYKPTNLSGILRDVMSGKGFNDPVVKSEELINAYKKLFAAVKQKDNAAIERSFSQRTREFAKSVAEMQKKPVEELNKNGLLQSTLSQAVPQMRNPISSGRFGAVEIRKLDGKWENTPFIYEDNNWKLAIGDLFAGTYKNPSEVNKSSEDVIVRATAAELLGEQPVSAENIESLKIAFNQSLATDKHENDAHLAILSALVKLNKTEAVESLKHALDSPDYLVRRHAAQLIKQNDLTKEFPAIDAKVGTVKPHNPASSTKLGQILYTTADYRRAVARRNGQARAIVATDKGSFAIEFFPEDAPLAVDNFIRLARSNYFNNVAIHRVVPNFVVQDGDPRGDGNGSPGWQIRCEINQIPYERGAVGMALSGKDTGGSQWFVTHSPQPHLDGGYTVFGRVNETDMKIVDTLARGDKILSVKILEGKVSPKGRRKGK